MNMVFAQKAKEKILVLLLRQENYICGSDRTSDQTHKSVFPTISIFSSSYTGVDLCSYHTLPLQNRQDKVLRCLTSYMGMKHQMTFPIHWFFLLHCVSNLLLESFYAVVSDPRGHGPVFYFLYHLRFILEN